MFQRAARSYDELQSALYGDPQLSRQNQKPHGKNKIPHGKTENLTAKTKYLTTKPKPSRQNQRPHGKTKYFTAKTKYLTSKANTHVKTKAILFLLWSIWFCREVFGFAVRYFVFAVRFLVLPWGILFLPWGFWFSVLLWRFWFCRDVFGFAVTVVGHHSFAMNNPAQHCITWLSKCSAQKLDATRNLQPIKFHIQISPLIKTSPVVHLAAAQHKCVAWHKHSSYSVYKKAFDKQFSKLVWNSWSWQRVWRTVVRNQIAKFETK